MDSWVGMRVGENRLCTHFIFLAGGPRSEALSRSEALRTVKMERSEAKLKLADEAMTRVSKSCHVWYRN